MGKVFIVIMLLLQISCVNNVASNKDKVIQKARVPLHSEPKIIVTKLSSVLERYRSQILTPEDVKKSSYLKHKVGDVYDFYHSVYESDMKYIFTERKGDYNYFDIVIDVTNPPVRLRTNGVDDELSYKRNPKKFYNLLGFTDCRFVLGKCKADVPSGRIITTVFKDGVWISKINARYSRGVVTRKEVYDKYGMRIFQSLFNDGEKNTYSYIEAK